MKAASTPTPVPGAPSGGGGLPSIIPKVGGTSGLGALASSLAVPLGVVAAGAVAMTGIFAVGAKLITQGDTLAEREKKWAEWERAHMKPAFGGSFSDPMSAKYASPTFNVYVGAETVADAVVPVIARTVSTTPRGGR